MAKENGQVDEAEMMEDSEIEKKIEEVKSANKELGLPELDADDGREDSEEDGEGGTSKAAEPKTKPSKASAKAEGKVAERPLNTFRDVMKYLITWRGEHLVGREARLMADFPNA